jgi:GDPmannose 4,6-dehydratase
MAKKALITGITGQDGSYLAELLLERGYEVHGLVRRVAMEDPHGRLGRISGLADRVQLHPGSVESYPTLVGLFARVQFDACFHLAAQSHVAESLTDPFSTMNTNVNGTHCLLAAIKELQPRCRFYFAGSAEMFGAVRESPQDESTPFNPRNPYGISKVAAYHLVRSYRENHGLACSSAILFNHESPRRGLEFVTRKITATAAKIRLGLTDHLALGSLDARRDWGWAPDYMEGALRIVEHDTPGDYVLATGEAHTVREFCALAFEALGLDYQKFVRVDARFVRPDEPVPLIGNPSKAQRELGWSSRVPFAELVRRMALSDLEQLEHRDRSVIGPA